LRSLTINLIDRVDHTSMLVENLLHWARSQLEGFQMEPRDLDIAQLAEGQLLLLQPQAEAKNIHIHNRIQPATQARGEQNMIELVIRNLLSNAIKFTGTGGTIQLDSGINGTMVWFSIKDTGVGFSDEVKSKLFSSEQFSTQGTKNEKGSGLGLMLVRDFVEKNSGTITVDSQEGEGTEFTVRLPKARSQRSRGDAQRHTA
jgi:signal transduction histidine kinase